MNYRIPIIILTSLLIGTAIGWFAVTKYNTTSIKKVNPITYVNQTIQTESTKTTGETTEKSIELSLSELGDCANDIVSLHPLVVQYAQNATCNCDEAKTTLEMNFCSGIKACIERKKFDVLCKKILAKYEPLIAEQNQFIQIAKETKDPSLLENYPDYKTAKTLQEKSFRMYLNHVELESDIVQIETRKGTGRIIYMNSRVMELLKKKNNELEKLLKD